MLQTQDGVHTYDHVAAVAYLGGGPRCDAPLPLAQP